MGLDRRRASGVPRYPFRKSQKPVFLSKPGNARAPPAATIGELEAMFSEETGTEGSSCNYPLGEAIFLDLYHSLGEDTFSQGLRRLYLKDLHDDPTDGCEGTQLRICHLISAFKTNVSEDVAAKVTRSCRAGTDHRRNVLHRRDFAVPESVASAERADIAGHLPLDDRRVFSCRRRLS